jgi:hypothetical protein
MSADTGHHVAVVVAARGQAAAGFCFLSTGCSARHLFLSQDFDDLDGREHKI